MSFDEEGLFIIEKISSNIHELNQNGNIKINLLFLKSKILF